VEDTRIARERAEAERRARFRRVLIGSAAAHVLLVLGLVFGPTPRAAYVLPAVVSVDLVALPGAAAPAPPAPRPPPPKPPQKQVVLPAKPQKPPKPKKPEPKAKPEPKPPPKAKEPEPVDYDDLMAELREERGEVRPDQVARGAPGGSQGPGVPVPPEVAAWMQAARVRVRQAWVLPAGFRSQPLETQIRVDLDAAGNVVGEPEIVRGSGNPWYDESVVRAVQKASPLPRPPEAGSWPFVFRPEDWS
jgi:periplasmic protein TonB